ncbi:MAG: hypothetical protein AAGD22_15510 [Verrucomicrobiota bacterium]
MKQLAPYTIGLFACAAFYAATPVAQAGEMVEPIVVVEEGSGSLIDPVTGAVSFGYDSTYFFRGTNFGKDAPWASFDFSVPAGAFTIDGGIWYINPTSPSGAIPSDDNDELDLYISASTTLGPVDVWLGYTAYIFPEFGSGSTNEIGVGFGTSISIIDLGFGYYHDFDLETNYFEYSIGTSVDITDFLTGNIGVVLGHFEDTDFHGIVSGGLDVAITDAATFSSYIAYNFVGTEKRDRGFESGLFGGVSISVGF